MDQPVCVITDFMGDNTEIEERSLSESGFQVFVAPSPDPADWVSAAERADAILTRHAPIGAETIGLLKRCKIIARYGTGHDNIDVVAADKRSIIVTNVPGYCTDEVADHALMLLLMSVRHVESLTDAVRTGGWTPQPLPPIERLRGRRLGLIGLGRIGSAVAERAMSFALEVEAFDPFVTRAPVGVTLQDTLESLLERSNFVSLHTPLTPDTHHLLDATRLAMLQPGAFVINVARGGLLDLEAAIDALGRGHLAGVAVDVAEIEPLGSDHPARNTPGLIVTPHVSYYSKSSVDEAKRRSVEEIVRVVSGESAMFPVTITL